MSISHYLEEDFKKQINNQDVMMSGAGGLDEVAKYEFYVQRLMGQMDERTQEEAQQYLYQDPVTPNLYPFAVAFFLFRSGQHSLAIDYLKASPSEEVRAFGELYRRWYYDYGMNVPRSLIQQFYNEAERLIPSVKDMYKSVLTHLMIGCQYTPANQTMFYEHLLPYELEIQLWIKVLLIPLKFLIG